MSKKTILIILLGLFFTPSVLFSQITDTSKIKMNRISLQTGLFHYFFDGAPILNINHREFAGEPRQGIFSQLFINSIGLQYNRKINNKNALSVEFMSFWNRYYIHSDSLSNYFLDEAIVFGRFFSTVNISYSRIQNLSTKFDLIYGGGVNYRNGRETILLGRSWIELQLISSSKNDFGLNAFAGIDYTPLKWLTLYTRIDFMTLVYINDKEAIKRFKENYNNVPSHFPSRYDLSLRFGIGVNF